MRFLSILFLSLVSVFGQVNPYPTLSPASATVTYDKAVDTVVTLPPVTITAGNSNFFYSVYVPVDYSAVITYAPMVGFLLPNATNTIQMAVNAQSLNVGTYSIPVSFVQATPSTVVGFSITLNVTDSRTYVLPGATDRQIPHIAAGDVWKTKVRLVNTGIVTSVSEIRFYNAAGQAENFAVNGFLTSYVPGVAIPAKGFVDLILDNPSGLKVGTATIKPLIGDVPGVNVVYMNSSPAFESAVEIKQPNKANMTIVFNNVGRNSTGIAISNALNYNQELTFEFFDEQGQNLVPTGTTVAKVRIPQNGQYIATMGTVWPFTAGKTGTIRITGTQPALYGFGLQFDLDKGVFYTQPVF
jgi:hypothetical protein